MRVGQYDLANSLLVCTAVFYVEGCGLGTAVGLMALRTVVWAVHISSMMRPLQAWQRQTQQLDDDELLRAATRSLEILPRFFRVYTAGWLATVAVLAAIGVAGLQGPAIGKVELLCGGLLLLGVLSGLAGVVLPLLDELLFELRKELGAELLSRELSVPTNATSITKQRLLSNLGMACGGVSVMLAVAVFVGMNARREAALAEQHRLAELGAVAVAHGGELDGELAALERVAELPAWLAKTAATGETALYYARPEERATAAAPVPGAVSAWVLASAPIEQDTTGLMLFLLVFYPGATLPIVRASRAHARVTMEPIRQLSEAAARVADDGDLRSLARIVPLRQDAIGQLALEFNRMVALIGELSHAAGAVARGELDVDFEGSGELRGAFRAMLDALREIVIEIRTTAVEVGSAAAEIQASMEQQALGVHEQSGRVAALLERVGSLTRAAQEITAAAQAVRGDAEQALGARAVVVARLEDLTGEASSVGELAEGIREIADRSDLLALNGSLEATRAGEAGRGFLLVAGEMRRLAERVTGTVADVQARVSAIERASGATVAATERSRALSHSTVAAAGSISTLTSKQSEDTSAASLGVQELAELIVAGGSAVSQTRAAAEGLRERALELEALTARFSLGAERSRSGS